MKKSASVLASIGIFATLSGCYYSATFGHEEFNCPSAKMTLYYSHVETLESEYSIKFDNEHHDVKATKIGTYFQESPFEIERTLMKYEFEYQGHSVTLFERTHADNSNAAEIILQNFNNDQKLERCKYGYSEAAGPALTQLELNKIARERKSAK